MRAIIDWCCNKLSWGDYDMAKVKYEQPDCIAMLREKQELLKLSGEERYPQRSDFSNDEVVAIKAFLGPWPRALELAGLKPPRGDDRKTLNIEKRIRAKKRRIIAKKQERENARNINTSDMEHDVDH